MKMKKKYIKVKIMDFFSISHPLMQCDGILCSGPSPENMASTVVDCRKLTSESTLAFFRIGVVPRSQVETMFAKVKAFYNGGSVPPTMSDTGHVNPAFRVSRHKLHILLPTCTFSDTSTFSVTTTGALLLQRQKKKKKQQQKQLEF